MRCTSLTPSPPPLSLSSPCALLGHNLEYFEHDTDPWQMHNAWKRTDAATLASYHARLQQFKTCKGKACRAL